MAFEQVNQGYIACYFILGLYISILWSKNRAGTFSFSLHSKLLTLQCKIPVSPLSFGDCQKTVHCLCIIRHIWILQDLSSCGTAVANKSFPKPEFNDKNEIVFIP